MQYNVNFATILSNYKLVQGAREGFEKTLKRETGDKEKPITENRANYLNGMINGMLKRESALEDIFAKWNIPITNEEGITIFSGNYERVKAHCSSRPHENGEVELYNHYM